MSDDTAILQLRGEVSSLENSHPDYAKTCSKLVVALLNSFTRANNIEYLDEAIVRQIDLIDKCFPSEPDGQGKSQDGRAGALFTLAAAYITRYHYASSKDDLHRGIGHYREALEIYGPGHKHHAQGLSSLAVALRHRFNVTGDMQDITAATDYGREAVATSPDWMRGSAMNNLGSSYLAKYWKTTDRQDLVDAIQYFRDALALFSAEKGLKDNRSKAFNNLGVSLWNLFKRDGDAQELDSAIDNLRHALEFHPVGHPGRLSNVLNLASALSDRFDLLGRVEDIDAAVMYSGEAISICPSNHVDRGLALKTHGLVMFSRYKVLAMINDLNESRIAFIQAMSSSLPSDRHSVYSNLSQVMYAYFSVSGNAEHLDAAIGLLQQAIASTDYISPYDLAMTRILLGGFLTVKFMQTKVDSCIDEAIQLLGDGLADKNGINIDAIHALSCDNLSYAYHIRFKTNHDLADLDLATNFILKAIEYTPHDDVRSGGRHNVLANLSVEKGDFRQAFEAYETVATQTNASLVFRGQSAMIWGMRAQEQGDFSSAIKAYKIATPLLEQGLLVYPSVLDRQTVLAQRNSMELNRVGSYACSGALSAGLAEDALELLERGRAMVLGKMRGYRITVDLLRTQDRGLADEFERLSLEMERLELSLTIDSTPSDSSKPSLLASPPLPAVLSSLTNSGIAYEQQARRRRALAADWEAVLRKIRVLPGFEDFLQVTPFSKLKNVSAEGPVIVVNVNKYRSDAIILMHSQNPIVVPLSSQVDDIVHTAALGLQQAKKKRDDDISPIIQSILRDLWDCIASPVVEHLHALNVPPKSRIWWCPTGDLCTLPLHAAGSYRSGQRALPDLYISSYTPTLSALLAAREGHARKSSLPRVLAVGQPSSASQLALPSVEEELQVLSALLGPDIIDVLQAKAVNRESVSSGLQSHSWAHFACHGHVNVEPFSSSFELLDNDRITLLDILKMRLPSAELAFLSACHSAAIHGESVSLDEVLHLAAALQFSGFRSVVGTLWGIVDEDAPDVTQHFYEFMFRHRGSEGTSGVDFRDAAEALSRAVRKMRKKKVSVDRWVPFVHVGA